MTESRWIRWNVATFEHDFFQGEAQTRHGAFMWLVANAAWKTHRIRNKGKMMTLERGQCVAGLEYLAKEWRWGIKKVRRFLSELEAEGMIKKGKSRGHYAQIITICNYEKFQSCAPTQGQEQGQEQGKCGASVGQDSTKIYQDISKVKNARVREDESILENAALQNGVTLEGGGIVLRNGTRSRWLARFDGDAEALDLALIQARAYLRPDGPALPIQVEAQLAMAARAGREKNRNRNEKMERTRRAAAVLEAMAQREDAE